MRSSLPRGDYFAIVNNAWTRPRSDVYAWRLPDRMPGIRIPLAGRDENVALDLQAVLDTAYDRAQYGGTLNYSAPLLPQTDAETQKWIDGILADRKSSNSSKL
jgi:hypothetical protein